MHLWFSSSLSHECNASDVILASNILPDTKFIVERGPFLHVVHAYLIKLYWSHYLNNKTSSEHLKIIPLFDLLLYFISSNYIGNTKDYIVSILRSFVSKYKWNHQNGCDILIDVNLFTRHIDTTLWACQMLYFS